MKQNFQKFKIVTGKTPFSVIGTFCTPRSICPEIGVFDFSIFNKNTVLKLLEKGFRVSENLFQSKSIENIQNFQWLLYKNMPISQTESHFENP